MVEKNHHAKSDAQGIGKLKDIRMLVPAARQHLHSPDLHLQHADISMEIHNRQSGAKEQQQPDQHE
ncbi:hypothetical protein D3C74_482470 [compost metagenome]